MRGLVQGVGFRPHVYRCATAMGLTGFVCNGPEGVDIEVEGRDLDGFIEQLRRTLPPLARIDSLIESPLAPCGDGEFGIAETRGGAAHGAAIPADIAICGNCLEELFDPGNRRFLHPFIACCNCGPRYTMTRRLPYDRANTAMQDFNLCSSCAIEYRDPTDRRFHAEPVACHDCGPQLSAEIGGITRALEQGDTVAIKGIGGYHLACDARNPQAVKRLRQRKLRDGKPFAVMVLNAASAAQYIEINASTRQLLTSAERPIVVAPSTAGHLPLGEDLARGLGTLGVMLPYTGLHYLLFHSLLQSPTGHDWLELANDRVLVMTSANISGEPLITDPAEAEQRLAGVADRFLHHDRDIPARADDSVVLAQGSRCTVVRRARGFTPHAIKLGHEAPPVLALGPQLKTTITLTRGRRAYVSPHLGDLATPAAIAFHRRSADAMEQMLRQRPEVVACDLARDYASTRLAEQISTERGLPLVRVQHHHAHVAAVMAEHRISRPVIGLALDGHGQGYDGEAWGGELLLVNGGDCQRLGHLTPLPLPGGDRAAREPWRMAAGALQLLGRGGEIIERFSDQPLAAGIADWLQRGEIARTSAAGRLFDAAAGLLGVSGSSRFEGEPPMLLEGLVGGAPIATDAYQLQGAGLDMTPLLARLADTTDPAIGAREFHGTLIRGLVDWTVAAAASTGVETVILCGGCFLNRYLADAVPEALERAGLEVLQALTMPPNDGSISLGQAWVAQHTESITRE